MTYLNHIDDLDILQYPIIVQCNLKNIAGNSDKADNSLTYAYNHFVKTGYIFRWN